MKIRCHCGRELLDHGDDLPHKGHLIPDQDWFATCDALDALIDEVALGRSTREAAYHRSRTILSRAARQMWQCRHCGRLYIGDRDRQLRCFHAEGEPIAFELLRSRPG